MTGVVVIAVYHGIGHAYEKHLRKVFGREYPEYYSRVRQYK
jgi:protein-S-isoprenylcysteine O-methyltransferase Ste14